jgi:dihydrofolate synthase/folylpolyglutamate synthase
MHRLLPLLGLTEATLPPVVHLAGTNGKGSVQALLASLLHAHGLQVGSTISPHLHHPAERLRLNGHALSVPQYGAAMARLTQTLTQHLGPQGNAPSGNAAGGWPSYFELHVLLALHHFTHTQPVDVLILETGLGGRLDATNALAHKALCIITSIGLDHTEVLGPTLAHIATEKAGIFRPHVPIVLGPSVAGEALATLQAQAATVQAGPVTQATLPPLPAALGLGQGLFHQHNAATALCALAVLAQQGLLGLNPAAVEEGLAQARWAGRFQHVAHHQLLVDGAHNEEGLNAFAESLEAAFPERALFWLLSLKANRDPDMLRQLLQRFAQRTLGVVCVPSPTTGEAGERFDSHCPVALRAYLRQHLPALASRPIWAGMEVSSGLRLLRSWNKTHSKALAGQASLGVVVGSLYTAGAVLAGLNEGPL